MSKVEWRNLPGADGMYQVSNYGDIKSYYGLEPKILKQQKGTDGRMGLQLKINGVRSNFNTHKLVAMCFLNHVPCGYKLVINHIDFNYLNNHVSNLEEVTARVNANQKHIKSSSKYTGVHRRSEKGRWRSGIYFNGKTIHLGTFDTEIEASIVYEKKLKEINKL